MNAATRLLVRGLALTLASILSSTAIASAQAPDFWFHQPRGSISFYGGWFIPRENSDLFDFVREEVTIQRGDFNGPLLGADVAWQLNDHLDAVLGIEGTRRSRGSELWHWEEPVDWSPVPQPIQQTNEFSTSRLTAGARFYPMARGRTIGSHAWVPARWAPFVGGGAGIVWYSFEQFGDFVDVDTADHPDGPEIFTATLRSTGSGATAHALAGLEISLRRNLVLRGEYRYVWGGAPVDSRVFRNIDGPMDNIDLAGHRAAIGLAVRF